MEYWRCEYFFGLYCNLSLWYSRGKKPNGIVHYLIGQSIRIYSYKTYIYIQVPSIIPRTTNIAGQYSITTKYCVHTTYGRYVLYYSIDIAVHYDITCEESKTGYCAKVCFCFVVAIHLRIATKGGCHKYFDLTCVGDREVKLLQSYSISS